MEHELTQRLLGAEGARLGAAANKVMLEQGVRALETTCRSSGARSCARVDRFGREPFAFVITAQRCITGSAGSCAGWRVVGHAGLDAAGELSRFPWRPVQH